MLKCCSGVNVKLLVYNKHVNQPTNQSTTEATMALLLTLNAFLLFVIGVKIERAVARQFSLDDDDAEYNDWDFDM